SMPRRLEKQLAYLKKNKNVGMVGCYTSFIDQHNKIIKNLPPSADRFKLILTKPHINRQGLHIITVAPSHFFRTSILAKLDKPYFRNITHNEDFDFQFRLMEKKIQIFNMPDILYHYRMHPHQTTNDQTNLFLFVSLVRYATNCRRKLGFDPLNQLLKKYNMINKKNIVSSLTQCIKIKNLSHHKIFFHEWFHDYYDRTDLRHKKLLIMSAIYQQKFAKDFFIEERKIFIEQQKKSIIEFYLASAWLYMPWRFFKKTFKKIIGINKK
ncbi:MAG: hypothetical protein ACR2NY_02345, partial [Alphaproteobacteria bacterium]